MKEIIPTKPKKKAKAMAHRRVIEINVLDIPHTMSEDEADKALDIWLERIGRK